MEADNWITLTLTREQVAMLRSLVYQGVKDAANVEQVDFFDDLVDQLEQAEGV